MGQAHSELDDTPLGARKDVPLRTNLKRSRVTLLIIPPPIENRETKCCSTGIVLGYRTAGTGCIYNNLPDLGAHGECIVNAADGDYCADGLLEIQRALQSNQQVSVIRDSFRTRPPAQSSILIVQVRLVAVVLKINTVKLPF